MIDFMDEIVDSVGALTEVIVYILQMLLIGMLKGVILLTTPIWVLPYMFFKDISSGK